MPPASEHDTTTEEVGLVAQTGAGNRAAFRQLYARYSAPLFAMALRMAGNRTDAEEMLQDAFVKIWRHAPSYDSSQSRPFTWAVTILRRTCIDHLRRRRRAAVSPELLAELAATAAPPSGESPRSATMAREDAGRVRDVLASFPAEQRAVLELALFSGLTHTEIAGQLRQPVGTVKSWIRRGILDLRSALTRSDS